MQWTYTTYTIADYSITIGLVLSAIFGVFAIFFSSKKGQEFIFERVIGVDPIKAHANSNDQDPKQKNIDKDPLENDGQQPDPIQLSGQVKHKSLVYIGILCCLLGGTILSITAVLVFQGSFLTSARLLPDDDCPEYPVDCFIFGKDAFTPITNNVSFICQRIGKAEFNTNISDATAWCYGWIIRLQTTKSVLDQLGVAIALIGFFTTMLAVIVYLGKCKKTIILSIIFISTCGGLIIILLVLKWSFAPLTYAILALGVGLGIFGIVLFYIIPKPVKQKNNAQLRPANINQSKQTVPITTAPFYVETSNRTAKVDPR